LRLLAIGYPLPNPEIENYNAFTAPSYFDYDVVLIDPQSITSYASLLVDEGQAIEAYDGRPVVNGASTAAAVSAAELLRRRAEETGRFLEAGGVVIVTGRPNATQAGMIGFEGCDRYSWLPAPGGIAWSPPYLRAAEGQTIRIVAEDHPFASFLRDFRKQLAYRAVFDDRQPPVRQAGRVIATGGSGVVHSIEFRVLEGRVLFIPSLTKEVGTIRTKLATGIVTAARQLLKLADTRQPPAWVRTLAVPGLEQVEAELEEAKTAASTAEARLEAVNERHDTLAAHRRLVSADGRALLDAARQAFQLLGFAARTEEEQSGLILEADGRTAYLEVEGSAEAVVEWPYVRLQRRLEQRLLAEGDSPKGIVVVNGFREKAPDDRKGDQFTQPLRIACENYAYSLLTGETLFALVQRALGGADDAALLGIRRRLLATDGLLTLEAALGEVEEPRDSGPIF
jgi:hypothetical protein